MTAAPEIPADVMAAAREALAVEYERTEYGGGPYPTYADLARSGSGSFTLCSIRAIARAILAERERCVDYVRRSAGSIPNRQEIAAAIARGDVCDVFGSITQGPTT